MKRGIKDQFVDILREYVAEEGLKQCVFAKMIGKGEAYTSSLLHGKENISADRMDNIANKLGLKLEIFAESRFEKDS